MSAATRQMHLGVFVLGAGNHSAGWRWEGAAVSNNDLAVIQEIARIAERGKFDLLFVSDGLDYERGDLPSFMCRFEPTSLISVLSAHTTRLGLGATVSTSFAALSSFDSSAGIDEKFLWGKSESAIERDTPTTRASASRKAFVTDVPSPPLAPVISTTLLWRSMH